MPVTPVEISTSINDFFKLKSIKGRDAVKLANAIGFAVSTNIITPNMVSCTLNGTMGPIGNISSISQFGLVPKAMSSLMLSKATSMKLTGRDIIKLLDAVSLGISKILLGMVLSGTAVGIAVGAGVGSFTGLNAEKMSKDMYGMLKLSRVDGRDTNSLCSCISFGVVNHLKSSVRISVVVTGVIAPVPPVGPSAAINIPSLLTKVS